ncbi:MULTISPECIES: discoidin domain-containing protein [Flavobacterium]|nr:MULTISPECIES: discoidin domain-containing protein [Flavobacterium]QYS88054.1 discoidin domain-containing protein [Flavobacterium davisii]SPE77613.1 F5/8 type C domain protein [Flavobacterium columnare]
MKKIYTLFYALLLSLTTNAQETAFFVHAHQDDAVYFCGVPLFNKVSSGIKTVAIVTSASDQGAHDGVYTPDVGSGITTPFYQARDYGYKKALEYCYTNYNTPLPFKESTTEVLMAGKKVRKWTYGNNITMYFLDLPNGQCCSLDMGGYPANDNQSIEGLKKGKIKSITNVTGTSTYTWAELKATIKAIFNTEKGSTSNVYSTDVDMAINPGDHADHYITSVLALEAMDGMTDFTSNQHIDYQLSNLDIPNLSNADVIKKISTFGAMISGIGTKGYRASRHFDSHYERWFLTESIRTVKDTHDQLVNLNSDLGGNPFIVNTNIALNKPTTVSGSDISSTDGPKANDGNLNTYWGNTAYPQWWKVDLGTNYNVDDITVVNYFKDTRYYKYTISSSVDGVTWTQIASKSDTSDATQAGNNFTFSTPVLARYLKVDMTYNSVNQGVHISEFIAKGSLANVSSRMSIKNTISDKKYFKNPIKKGEILNIVFDNSTSNIIRLFDLNGKQLFNEIFNQISANINTDFLEKGIYILMINDEKTKLVVE